MDNQFDAIVIGSGMGGLSVASLLAQLGHKRVLVLERHFKLGGYTHGFTRQGYRFDPGLHYVGEMQPGGERRQIMDLITRGGVAWRAMPRHFEHASFPGLDFRVCADWDTYQADLCHAFPHERQAIQAYFRDVERLNGWIGADVAGKVVPAALRPFVGLGKWPTRHLAGLTTGAYLAQRFSDPRVKAILTATWQAYGLPPAQSALLIHTLIAHHYRHGGFYPEGGSGQIAASIQPVVEAAGGACLVNREVTAILTERGRAVGVRVRGPGDALEVFRAPVVISNAGAYLTFSRLVQAARPQTRASIAALNGQVSTCVQLYLGLKRSPAELGITGANRWLFDGLDHDAMHARRDDLLHGQAHTAYLSFPSLKDPAARQHTAEVLAPINAEAFQAWRHEAWRRRGEDYAALKTRITRGLLDLVERHHPGFGALVDLAELATPLSFEHFTGHLRGAIYGVPATPERFAASWSKPQTEIPGLYLTGTDVVSLGIVGAMMGGVVTASVLLGSRGYFDILAAARRAQPAGLPRVAATREPEPA